LPSDGRCTGTQKLHSEGQKLRTTSKSRLLDRIVREREREKRGSVIGGFALEFH
jgi:hypothetical protein